MTCYLTWVRSQDIRERIRAAFGPDRRRYRNPGAAKLDYRDALSRVGIPTADRYAAALAELFPKTRPRADEVAALYLGISLKDIQERWPGALQGLLWMGTELEAPPLKDLFLRACRQGFLELKLRKERRYIRQAATAQLLFESSPDSEFDER